MSEERWIVIPGWDRFQHYKDRDPPWIKLHRSLASDPEWLALSGHRRGVLICVWLEYASTHGRVRFDARSLSRRINVRVNTSDLETLVHAGFIEVSASKPLAPRYQDAMPEGEAEGERERKKVERKKPRNVDPIRSVPRNGTVCPHCGVPVSGPLALADHIDNVHW